MDKNDEDSLSRVQVYPSTPAAFQSLQDRFKKDTAPPPPPPPPPPPLTDRLADGAKDLKKDIKDGAKDLKESLTPKDRSSAVASALVLAAAAGSTYYGPAAVAGVVSSYYSTGVSALGTTISTTSAVAGVVVAEVAKAVVLASTAVSVALAFAASTSDVIAAGAASALLPIINAVTSTIAAGASLLKLGALPPLVGKLVGLVLKLATSLLGVLASIADAVLIPAANLARPPLAAIVRLVDGLVLDPIYSAISSVGSEVDKLTAPVSAQLITLSNDGVARLGAALSTSYAAAVGAVRIVYAFCYATAAAALSKALAIIGSVRAGFDPTSKQFNPFVKDVVEQVDALLTPLAKRASGYATPVAATFEAGLGAGLDLLGSAINLVKAVLDLALHCAGAASDGITGAHRRPAAPNLAHARAIRVRAHPTPAPPAQVCAPPSWGLACASSRRRSRTPSAPSHRRPRVRWAGWRRARWARLAPSHARRAKSCPPLRRELETG